MTDRPDPSPGVPGTRLPAVSGMRDAVQRWRLVYARDPVGAEPAQREQLAAWDRALRTSGLPCAGLGSAAGKPRFAIAAPLAGAIPGEAELVDVWLVQRLPRWRVREALAGALPAGHRLVDLYDVWLGEAALPGQVVASVYRATLSSDAPSEPAIREAAAVMLAAAALPRRRRKGEGTVPYDLRPFVAGLHLAAGHPGGGPVLWMELRHDPEKGIGRPEEVLAELGERVGRFLEPVALVRERLVLTDDQPGAASARRDRK